jgi:hypothetical protein
MATGNTYTATPCKVAMIAQTNVSCGGTLTVFVLYRNGERLHAVGTSD